MNAKTITVPYIPYLDGLGNKVAIPVKEALDLNLPPEIKDNYQVEVVEGSRMVLVDGEWAEQGFNVIMRKKQ